MLTRGVRAGSDGTSHGDGEPGWRQNRPRAAERRLPRLTEPPAPHVPKTEAGVGRGARLLTQPHDLQVGAVVVAHEDTVVHRETEDQEPRRQPLFLGLPPTMSPRAPHGWVSVCDPGRAQITACSVELLIGADLGGQARMEQTQDGHTAHRAERAPAPGAKYQSWCQCTGLPRGTGTRLPGRASDEERSQGELGSRRQHQSQDAARCGCLRRAPCLPGTTPAPVISTCRRDVTGAHAHTEPLCTSTLLGETSSNRAGTGSLCHTQHRGDPVRGLHTPPHPR